MELVTSVVAGLRRDMRASFVTTLMVALGGLPVIAQQTWVVDPSGTGNFSDLRVAIATASAGDTLLLRGGGRYIGLYQLDKALHVVGEPTQRAYVEHLAQTGATTNYSSSVRQLDCDRIEMKNPTILEDVQCVSIAAGGVAAGPCRVMIARSTIGGSNDPSDTEPAIGASNADILIEGSTILGNAPLWILSRSCYVIHPSLALAVSYCTVSINETTITGGDSALVGCLARAPAGPAVFTLAPSRLTMRATLLRGGADQNGTRVEPFAIAAGTSVRLDPTVVTIPPSSTGSPINYADILASRAPVGNLIHCQVTTLPNSPAVLVASIGQHNATSTIYGDAWIDPSAYVILRMGPATATGDLTAAIHLSSSTPSGLPITIQGLTLDPVSGLLAAGAATVVQV